MVAICMVTTICMVGFSAEQKTVQMTVTWNIKKITLKNAFFSLLFLYVSGQKFRESLSNLTFFFRFLNDFAFDDKN